MATDLVLRTLTSSCHRGHLVSLLRNAVRSGFFDHDDPDLFARNEALVDQARASFQENDVFPSGPAGGRRILTFSTQMQALALMGRLPIAAAELQDRYEEIEHPMLDRPYVPFLIDDDARREILEAISIVDGDVDAATAFLDANHGSTAVVVCE